MLARATLSCLGRASPAPLIGLLLLCAWPLLATRLAGGISSRGAHGTSDSYEFAFIAVLVGAVAGLGAVGRLRAALVRSSASARCTLGFSAVALSSGLAGIVILAVRAPFAESTDRGVVWSGIGAALVLSVLHVSSIASAIVASPLPASARTIALVAIAWLIPAFVPDRFARTALLRAAPPSDWTASTMEFVPILAWLAAALLLEVTRTRRA